MSFEPITIPLQRPLMFGDVEVKQIVFEREMEAGDLQGISVTRMNHDDIYTVAGRMTGIPSAILKKMKMPDYKKVAAVVSGFLDDSPETGESQ